nr:putative nucleotidyltransferase, ribonuclease H [Tanacetum cinerariifolium]
MIEVTNENVAVAKEKLKEARTRQKSYADKHRRSLEFQPGDRVFLKVSPARGVRRFGIKGKLSPHFTRPFEILDRVGEVSYRLALPPQLGTIPSGKPLEKLRSLSRLLIFISFHDLDDTCHPPICPAATCTVPRIQSLAASRRHVAASYWTSASDVAPVSASVSAGQ